MENVSNVQEVYLNKVFFSLLAIWTTQNPILQICTTKVFITYIEKHISLQGFVVFFFCLVLFG